MRSFTSLKRAYDPLDLEMLEWVFDSAWTALQAKAALRDPEKDEQLKTALREKLFALACIDMDDLDTLRSRLVASMAPLALAFKPWGNSIQLGRASGRGLYLFCP
jgi:hypothetical protein